MGCSDTLEGAEDGSYFEACGPTYVDNGDENSSIQGLLNPVVSTFKAKLRSEATESVFTDYDLQIVG